MMFIVALGFLVLWMLGMVSSNMLGGLVHILLFFALSLVLIRVLSPAPQEKST